MPFSLPIFFKRLGSGGASCASDSPPPPRVGPQVASAELRALPGLEWAWSPALHQVIAGHSGCASGTVFTPGVKIFHDGDTDSLALRPGNDASGRPAGVVLGLSGFRGGFLSLVLDLPPEAVQGLKSRHLIRLDARIAATQAVSLYARLNIRHGPNLEQVVRQLPDSGAAAQVVEFDMFYIGLNEKRVESAWIDLIFNPAAEDEIHLSDLTVSRRPRAAL